MLCAFLSDLVKVAFDELKNKMEHVVAADDLVQFDDVGMSQTPESPYLSQIQALLPAIELPLHLLDRHHLVSLHIDRLLHRSIRSVPERAQHSKFIHFIKTTALRFCYLLI